MRFGGWSSDVDNMGWKGEGGGVFTISKAGKRSGVVVLAGFFSIILVNVFMAGSGAKLLLY